MKGLWLEGGICNVSHTCEGLCANQSFDVRGGGGVVTSEVITASCSQNAAALNNHKCLAFPILVGNMGAIVVG